TEGAQHGPRTRARTTPPQLPEPPASSPPPPRTSFLPPPRPTPPARRPLASTPAPRSTRPPGSPSPTRAPAGPAAPPTPPAEYRSCIPRRTPGSTGHPPPFETTLTSEMGGLDLPERYNVGADLLQRNLKTRASKIAIH